MNGKNILGTITSVDGEIVVPEGIDKVFIRVIIQPTSSATVIEYQFDKIFDDLITSDDLIDGFYLNSKYYGTIGITATTTNRVIKVNKNMWSLVWNSTNIAAGSQSIFRMRVYY